MIDILQSMFSDNNGIIGNNNKKKSRNDPNVWKSINSSQRRNHKEKI